MIDWLIHEDAHGTFLETPEEAVTYDDLRSAMAGAARPGSTVVAPSPDPGTVVEIYRALGRGPLIVTGRAQAVDARLSQDVMTLLFTSGTTGRPKSVPLTRENWLAAVSGSAAHLDHTQDDVWLMAMPLYHVGGLAVLFRSSFLGARVRLLPTFQPEHFADEMTGGATIVSVVPTMLRRILDVDGREYDGLRAVLVGGGPIPPGLLEQAWERGMPALPTYGMTETCAQVATLRPGSEPAYRADLVPGMEARITDAGRIALRGGQVFSGYLDGSGLDESGWFVTGDVGVLDGRSLRVLGRADDVIVTGGLNVDPVRVEQALTSHEGVSDAMVVGVPSAEWGSEVFCLYTGRADEVELREHVRQRLEAHEVPKRFVPVDHIPTTELGKPDRGKGRRLATEI